MLGDNTRGLAEDAVEAAHVLHHIPEEHQLHPAEICNS